MNALHFSISYSCLQYKIAHGFWMWIVTLIISTTTQSLSTFSLVLIRVHGFWVLLKLDALLFERHVCAGTKERGRDTERENGGWQRRGVTETITVIPCVTARRYALHHSSFICFLIPLFCVCLSVCSVTSQCLFLFALPLTVAFAHLRFNFLFFLFCMFKFNLRELASLPFTLPSVRCTGVLVTHSSVIPSFKPVLCSLSHAAN